MIGLVMMFFPQGTKRPADVVRIEKQRGRIEARSLWTVPAGELGSYLAQEYGWRAIMQLGWLERWRQHAAREAEAHVEQVTWVSSLPPERKCSAT